MNERQTLITIKAPPYRRDNKQNKSAIPDEIVALTGYPRTYATYLLRTAASHPPPRKRPRRRQPPYTPATRQARVTRWQRCATGHRGGQCRR